MLFFEHGFLIAKTIRIPIELSDKIKSGKILIEGDIEGVKAYLQARYFYIFKLSDFNSFTKRRMLFKSIIKMYRPYDLDIRVTGSIYQAIENLLFSDMEVLFFNIRAYVYNLKKRKNLKVDKKHLRRMLYKFVF